MPHPTFVWHDRTVFEQATVDGNRICWERTGGVVGHPLPALENLSLLLTPGNPLIWSVGVALWSLVQDAVSEPGLAQEILTPG